MPLGEIQAEHTVHICFGPDTHRAGGMRFNVLAKDGRKLSGVRTVESEQTLIRMLRYLGATDEQMAEYHDCRKRWGQGNSDLRLLPNRKNLLGLDHKLL